MTPGIGYINVFSALSPVDDAGYLFCAKTENYADGSLCVLVINILNVGRAECGQEITDDGRRY